MWVHDRVGQVLDATRFLSRLPLPQTGAGLAPLAVTLQAAPAAGLLIAAAPALLLWLGSSAGLPSLAAATAAVVALILVTGGLHEDGLADLADGFGGGATVSRKLAIMRDSRVGTFGALAVGTALLLRVAALQGLVDRAGPRGAALALLGAAALSRGLMLLPLVLLAPARTDGLGRAARADAGPVRVSGLGLAVVLGATLAAGAVADRLQVLAGLLGGGATALGLTRLAQHHIRGVTGDVVGATQQGVEIVFLLVLCVAAPVR